MSHRPRPSLQWHLITTTGTVLVVSFVLTFLALDHVLRLNFEHQLESDLTSHAMILVEELDHAGADEAGRADILNRFGLAYGMADGLFQIIDETGRVVLSSEVIGWGALAEAPFRAGDLELYAFHSETRSVPDREVRFLYYRMTPAETLRIGVDVGPRRKVLQSTRLVFGLGSLTTLAVSLLLVGYTTRRAISGVRQVRQHAETIRQQDDLSARVPLPTAFRETNQLAETFNAMMDRVQFLVKNLRLVMDHFAHDLKTPMTRLRGRAEQALRHNEELELAGTVVGECDRITEQLDTLLQIARTDAGLTVWRARDFDLAECVNECVEFFEPEIEVKGLVLHNEMPPALPLHADPQVMSRVVLNLIENAVKYTEAGSIQVSGGGDARDVWVTVCDTGIGIAATDAAMIFEPFFRTKYHHNREGYGLGLSYCRSVLKAMGGRIEYHPGEKGGSCFTVRLPSGK